MVLLYIGKAERQTFGMRISQENWVANRNADALKIYVGRLTGLQQISDEEWSQEMALAEKLLIYSHTPACNIQFITLSNDQELEDIHIFNWGNHCDLMAEVSGRRWASKYQIQLLEEYKYQT